MKGVRNILKDLGNGVLVDREEAINSNLGLVYKIAKKHSKRGYGLGYEESDLHSVGVIGLIKAFDNWEPMQFNGRVTKFVTYAYPMIEGYILNELNECNPGLKFSKRIKDAAHLILKYDLTGYSPKLIADWLDIPEKLVNEAITYLNHGKPVYLETKLNEDGGKMVTFHDFLGKEQDLSHLVVSEFMDSLEPRLKTIAIETYNGKNQSEIARMLGISHMQVNRGLKKLRIKLSNYLGDKQRKKKGGIECAARTSYL